MAKKSCPYCAQTDTKKDGYGYCLKYSCLSLSGTRDKIDGLTKRARAIYTMPDTYGQVGRVVSNPYSHRHRKADDIKCEAKKEFGHVPLEILDAIPFKYRTTNWDKNIRW